MNVRDRIKEFVKFTKIPISAFEKSILVTNGYVNSISKSIGIDKIELIIEKYPNLNIEWLLSGKGSMIKSITIEEDPPDNYKELAESRKETIDLLKGKVISLEKEIAVLRSKNAYDPSVQRGTVEFLNEPQLGEKIGK